MTKEEIITFQQHERAFASTNLGTLFLKFKNRLISACQADARWEYTDNGEILARKALASADEAEREFRSALEALNAPPKP